MLNKQQGTKTLKQRGLVTAFLTYRCNLRCQFCLMRGKKVPRQEEELSTSNWLEILETAWGNGFRRLHFNGGEPFYYKGFDEILTFASEKYNSVSINTNGTIWSNRFEKLVEKKPGNIFINLSLDGYYAQQHDKLRGEGCFNKVLDMSRLLSKNQIPFSVNTVVLPENWAHLEKIYILAETMGAKANQYFFPIIPPSGYDEHLLASPIITRVIIKLLKMSNRSKGIVLGGSFVGMARQLIAARKQKSQDRATSKVIECPLLLDEISDFVVDPFGRLSLCLSSQEHFSCDINGKKLAELLRDNKKNKAISPPITLKRKLKERCLKCRYKAICFIGCPAKDNVNLGYICKYLKSLYNPFGFNVL